MCVPTTELLVNLGETSFAMASRCFYDSYSAVSIKLLRVSL